MNINPNLNLSLDLNFNLDLNLALTNFIYSANIDVTTKATVQFKVYDKLW